MLKEQDLFLGTVDKVEIAIARLRQFEPPEGFYLAFSGGKDSVVIRELANMSGVKYDAHYNLTTIDPPELIYFIRKHHPDVQIDKPEIPLLRKLSIKGFPRRQGRWCCEEYKERGGIGRLVVTGVRKKESPGRKNRRMVEICYKDTTKSFLHVIIDWTEKEVWEFIKSFSIPYCKLYNEGWRRIGCLFCPCTYKKRRIYETEKYPRFTKAFIRAFEKLHENRKRNGARSIERWKNGEKMFWWWIRDMKPTNFDQLSMFE